MAEKNFLSIQEASLKLGKSIQTLRRLIKKDEIRYKRIKTPQGFNYLIEVEEKNASESDAFSNSPIQNQEVPLVEAKKSSTPIQVENVSSRMPVVPHEEADFYHLDLQKPEILPNHTLKKLLEESHKEKMFLISLIEKLQSEQQPKNWLAALYHYLKNSH